MLFCTKFNKTVSIWDVRRKDGKTVVARRAGQGYYHFTVTNFRKQIYKSKLYSKNGLVNILLDKTEKDKPKLAHRAWTCYRMEEYAMPCHTTDTCTVLLLYIL